jgi:hypothetical protein
MATKNPDGSGRRGAIRERSQFYNPQIERWVKRDTNTGKIMDVKQDPHPFKGVRRED